MCVTVSSRHSGHLILHLGWQHRQIWTSGVSVFGKYVCKEPEHKNTAENKTKNSGHIKVRHDSLSAFPTIKNTSEIKKKIFSGQYHTHTQTNQGE